MKEFTLNYVKRTKQENCYQDPVFKNSKSKKKAVLFKKIKSVVDLPDIWKKTNRYKTKNETRLSINLSDGNLYFSPPNQTMNLYQNVSFTEINPTFETRADEQSIINKRIKMNVISSNQNLLDTGVEGGFEYWNGDFINLPN